MRSFKPRRAPHKTPDRKAMPATIQIKPKNPNSRWVALDINNKIISEGNKPETVEAKAKKITDVFFLMFVPKEGVRYFF